MSSKPESEATQGWESCNEEPEGGTLAPSEELEQALREAADAVEARAAAREASEHDEPGDPEAGETEATGEPGAKGASEELEQLRTELAEVRDRWIRLNADFDNFRRRTLRDREEAHQFGHQALAKDLLPVVDNLGRAIGAARKSGAADLESLLQGLELVQRDLESVLSKYGVVEVEALGQPFDPSMHEALLQRPDESVSTNTVVEVFQRGYRLRDRLLRPAQVVVSTSGSGEGT